MNVLGKFNKYKIDLKGMTADKATYEFLLDNIFFADIDGPEVQKGKLNVVLTVKKSSNAYHLDFQIDGVAWVPCDRCLDDMEVPVSTSEKIVVKLGPEHGSEGDNIIIVPESEGDINVSWLIYEFISLSIPMKHVHGPGKCNKAMTGKLNKHLRSNENDDSEGEMEQMTEDVIVDDDHDHDHDDMPIDPRWNELKKIIDNN